MTSKQGQGGGPSSDAGKAVTKYNAVRAGHYTSTVPLPSEVDDYAAFETGMHAALLPIGTLEEELVRRISALAWRLRRFDRWDRTRIQLSAAKIQSENSSTFRLINNECPISEDDGLALAVVPKRTSDGETVLRASALERALHRQLLDTVECLRKGRAP
jgi:hypothetical protein